MKIGTDSSYPLSGSYHLTADIDLDPALYGGAEWIPIGNSAANSFTGTFDGQGHVVYNLTITGNRQHAGLFGYSTGVTIKNIGLDGTYINVSSSSSAGGICGYSSGSISNCYNTGSVSSSSSSSYSSSSLAGGICGYSYSASSSGNYSSGFITNCYWNIDSAQLVNGAERPNEAKLGVGDGTYTGTTTPLTTSEMQDIALVSLLNTNKGDNLNWHFDVDKINQGYPTLTCEYIVATIDTEPTCIEQGYTTYTCFCGLEYTDDHVPALDHDWDNGEVITPATEFTPGVMTYACHRCEETYSEEISPTHEHEFIAIDTEPTCTEDGYYTFICTCGSIDDFFNYSPPLGHDWDDGEVSIPPTEYSPGVVIYSCRRCSETYSEEIPPSPHEHFHVATATLPTCTEQGYFTFTCICGDKYNNYYAPALGHDWDTQTVAATCEASGYTKTVCLTCDEIQSHQEIIATGHMEITETISATCTENGYTKTSCSICSKVLSNIVHNAFGHIEDDQSVAPTCVMSGYNKSVCLTCGEVLVYEGIDALGHTEKDLSVAPTSTTAGYNKIVCLTCDEVLFYEDVEPIEESVETYRITVLFEGIKNVKVEYNRGGKLYEFEAGARYDNKAVISIDELKGTGVVKAIKVTNSLSMTATQTIADIVLGDNADVVFNVNTIKLTGIGSTVTIGLRGTGGISQLYANQVYTKGDEIEYKMFANYGVDYLYRVTITKTGVSGSVALDVTGGEYNLSEYFYSIDLPGHLAAVNFRGIGNLGGKPGESLELLKTMAGGTFTFTLGKDKYGALDFLFDGTNPFDGMFIVKFPGTSGATMQQYKGGWSNIPGTFDDLAIFNALGATSVRAALKGMTHQVDGLANVAYPHVIEISVKTITITGVSSDCNLAIVQSDWVYNYSPAVKGVPNVFHVFDNGRPYEVRVSREGYSYISIPNTNAGGSVTLDIFYNIAIPDGVSNVRISNTNWVDTTVWYYGETGSNVITLMKNYGAAKLHFVYEGKQYNYIDFVLDGSNPFNSILV